MLISLVVYYCCPILHVFWCVRVLLIVVVLVYYPVGFLTIVMLSALFLVPGSSLVPGNSQVVGCLFEMASPISSHRNLVVMLLAELLTKNCVADAGSL